MLRCCVWERVTGSCGGTHLLKLFAPKGAARRPSLVSSQVHDPPLTSTVARTIQYVEARTSSPRSSASGEGAHSVAVRRQAGMSVTQVYPPPRRCVMSRRPLPAGAGGAHSLARPTWHGLGSLQGNGKGHGAPQPAEPQHKLVGLRDAQARWPQHIDGQGARVDVEGPGHCQRCKAHSLHGSMAKRLTQADWKAESALPFRPGRRGVQPVRSHMTMRGCRCSPGMRGCAGR